MNSFITSKRIVTKGLLFVALFGTFALGTVLTTVNQIPVAKACTQANCSIATAMSDTVSDANPAVGETITYTLQGSAALTASTTITVTDQLGSGLTFVSATPSVGTYSSSTGVWNVGTLNSASNITLTITATVNASAAGRTINNTPSINFVGTNCNQTSAAGSATITVQHAPAPQRADLVITKTADVSSTVVGGTVNYTVTVTDLGPATSTNVVAIDNLPSGLTFVSSTASEGSYSSSTGDWTIGTLTANAPATLTIAATVNAGTASSTITNTAIVSESGETDQSPCNDKASVSVLVKNAPAAPQTADISITKSANVTSTEGGDTVTYTVTVENNGPATSTGVVATDILPAGVTFVSASATQGSYSSSTGQWNVGTLSNGQCVTLTITVTANTVTVDTSVTNTATVSESASTTDPNAANNTASVTICVEPCPTITTPTSTPTSTPVANLSIVKTVDDATPSAGDTINYTLTVTASGPATSTGVVATDTLPSGLTFENATASVGSYATSTGTWTIGDMSASSTATLNIAALVDASDTANQAITNLATVGETPSSTNQTGNSSSSVTVTVQGAGCTSSCGGGVTTPSADISITKTADVTSTNEGGTINYTITVTDLGPATSTDVVATDLLPSGLTLENATASVGSYASSTGTWTIGTLSASSTATLTIQALVDTGTAGTTITNTATVAESGETDSNTSNNTASVSTPVSNFSGAPTADLAVVKTVDNANPAAGATVNFTVTVTDNGPDTATFVDAQDLMPAGLAFVSATSSQGLYNMTTGAWNVGTIASNATATLQIAATVDPNDAGDTIVNTATVSSSLASLIDPNLANNSSSVTIVVQSNGGGCTSSCGTNGGGGGSVQSNIAIVKTVDDSTPATGDVIHYTLTVTDGGPSDSYGVVASDTLPAGITFDSASSSEGSYNSSTGIWTIGAVPSGQSATLVITATVTAAGGTTITNTGAVSENPGIINATPGNTSSSVSITVAGGSNGGGGGGGNGGGSSGGGGGGGGEVLGESTSTGQVLGASCGLYLDQYIHPIRKSLNDPTEVKKLQIFLNQNLGLNIPVTGYYGNQTIAAVNQFQTKYHTEVLAPWVPLGLPTQFTPTSYVYQSTQRWINLIMCPPLNLPLPALKVDTGE